MPARAGAFCPGVTVAGGCARREVRREERARHSPVWRSWHVRKVIETTGDALLSAVTLVGVRAASGRIRRDLKSPAGQREWEPGVVPMTRRTIQSAAGKAGHFGRAGKGATDEGMAEANHPIDKVRPPSAFQMTSRCRPGLPPTCPSLPGHRMSTVSVRQPRRPQGRCGLCGRRCPGYDQGDGVRRWRVMDPGATPVYLEAAAPRVCYRQPQQDGVVPSRIRLKLAACEVLPV